MLRRNLRGGSIFGQLISRKIIKVVASRCHILRLKCTKFDFWCRFVCQSVFSFVRLCLRWSLTHNGEDAFAAVALSYLHIGNISRV